MILDNKRPVDARAVSYSQEASQDGVAGGRIAEVRASTVYRSGYADVMVLSCLYPGEVPVVRVALSPSIIRACKLIAEHNSEAWGTSIVRGDFEAAVSGEPGYLCFPLFNLYDPSKVLNDHQYIYE